MQISGLRHSILYNETFVSFKEEIPKKRTEFRNMTPLILEHKH